MNIEQIKRKISKLEIEELAKSSGFQTRKPKKLEIIGFLGGFWLMVLALEHSLSSWARHICKLQGTFISKQALDKRLKKSNGLGKSVLQEVLKQPLSKALQSARYSRLFCRFTNVYVEDSTCISLPKGLATRFPGPYNKSGQSATARIQLRLNLLKDLYSNIELQSFRDNDQKHAKQILSILQVGDLVIRDLGYFSLKVFQQIRLKGAFFLSRYRYGVHVLDEQGQQIDLVRAIKKASAAGRQVVDMQVYIGKIVKVPVRLVAIRAPQAVILKRKRAAKKDRDRRLNHDKGYYDLLEWTIFVTNVPKDRWTYKAVFNAYRFRWRIEVIFKCWKSKFKFEQLFRGPQKLNENRAEMTIYILLAMLTLFYARWYYFFAKAVYEKIGKEVSPLKFADFVKERFWELLLKESNLQEFVSLVAYYCSYEKRKRVSHLELLFNPLS
jgi:hypothetical protein